MSLFRFGKAILRSVVRSADVFKKGQAKASKVPWHNGSKKVVVHHGQTRSDSLLYSSSPRTGYLLSSLTRPVRHGFASTRSKLGIEYGSFLKGHRVFRLLRKGQIQGPLFAFLGFVCTDIGAKTSSTPEEENDFLKLYQWMQKGIQSTQQEMIQSEDQSDDQRSLKLSDYTIGQRLGEQSSNSAVYEVARTNNDDKRFAVKMLFNFFTNSNSVDIEKAFSKEKQVLSKSGIQDEESSYVSIPTHPNILPVLHSFVDEVPCLPDARDSYPAALPPKYTLQGIGRNMTMFLVMPRLDCTLHQYLKSCSPSKKTSELLLLQLLEGVSHLVDNGVAHRDMKPDNLLVDMSYPGCPRLVICDFGCCLAERKHGLKMPFVTEETDRGGNIMLMPPEVITAQCGHGAIIDYSKADAWSCGAIAYELFGQPNPFGLDRLDSSSYQDEELPDLAICAPAVRWVVKKLLCRNMADRLTARQASIILKVKLFAPSEWLSVNKLVTQGDVLRWLVLNSSKSLKQRVRRRIDNIETMLKLSFLAKTTVSEVSMALALLRHLQN